MKLQILTDNLTETLELQVVVLLFLNKCHKLRLCKPNNLRTWHRKYILIKSKSKTTCKVNISKAVRINNN